MTWNTIFDTALSEKVALTLWVEINSDKRSSCPPASERTSDFVPVQCENTILRANIDLPATA